MNGATRSSSLVMAAVTMKSAKSQIVARIIKKSWLELCMGDSGYKVSRIIRVLSKCWLALRGVGNGGARGLPPYFQALNIEKKMKLVYLNCPRHTYYSSLPHVIARSHKIS